MAENNIITMPSGVKYEDHVVGAGATPNKGQMVTVHYTGWLDENGTKGKKFDSSRDRGQPFTFKIGVQQVISGWDLGVCDHAGRRAAHAHHPGRARLRPARRRQRDPARRDADFRRGAA